MIKRLRRWLRRRRLVSVTPTGPGRPHPTLNAVTRRALIAASIANTAPIRRLS